MDFFGAQDEARKQTRWLIGAFVATVISVVAIIYLAISGLLMQSSEMKYVPLWDLSRFVVVAGVVTVVIMGASFAKISEYRTGGGVVAQSMGGRLLRPGTDNLEEQRLLNVVEEMSLASGVPVPEVYLLEEEMGINAFAAGFGTEDAAIAVTRGCLYGLSRDELQGVIAHEFSHILNGDMRMNLKMAGWIFGLFFLSIVGSSILRTMRFTTPRRGKDKGGGVAFILAIAVVLLICGFIGQLCGRLVQAAVSRKREFLADASAVQFTRNPEGIRDALRRIGGASIGGKIEKAQASGVAHFFFTNALSLSGGGLMSTHPPLGDRLKAIDAGWDGSMLKPRDVKRVKEKSPNSSVHHNKGHSLPFAKGGILASIGMLSDQEIHIAQQLRARLPEAVSSRLRNATGALAVVLGLLIEKEPIEFREPGSLLIGKAFGQDLVNQVIELLPHLGTIAEKDRLAVLELALPALRDRPSHDLNQLIALVDTLIELDHHISLLEMGVFTILKRRLGSSMERAHADEILYTRVESVRESTSLLLAWLAKEDERSSELVDESIKRAFKKTVFEGKVSRRKTGVGSYAEGVAAFDQLRHCSMRLKSDFLHGCVAIVTSDGNITSNEANLIRVFAVAMGCPMPILH